MSLLNTGFVQSRPAQQLPVASFYSVELLIQELQILYQFRIWNSSSGPMFILVKENSALLDRLKVGSVYKSRYYSTDAGCPTVDLRTRIQHIARDERGRFKGYYLIKLAILKDSANRTIH